MLRVTVELWLGGRESGRRVIATADIGRIKDGALADYEVELQETVLDEMGVGDIARVRSYPRWSASVWDLVARAIAVSLNAGKEELPPRPLLPEVPVHVRRDGVWFVRLDEIPKPARTFFEKNIAFSGIPASGCAWAHDWLDFLEGRR